MFQPQYVWDLFIRFFHWSLVVSFILAYYTSTSGDDEWHAICGYSVTLLIVLRITWGCITSGYAKFTRFNYALSEIWKHGRHILQNRPAHYVGHSPIGSVMVYILLLLLSFIVITGLVSQGWTEYEGPLWWLGILPGSGLGRVAENIHELLPDIIVIFIALHVLGVLLACVQHKENLVSSMFTGRKSKK